MGATWFDNRWVIVYFETNGRSKAGSLESPRYMELYIESKTKGWAVRKAYNQDPSLRAYQETTFDPRFGEFNPEIFSGKPGRYFAIYHFSEHCGRFEIRKNRRQRANELLATYSRPAEEKSYDELPPNIRKHITIARNDCWVWYGSISYSEYGSVRFQNKNWAAHRLVYTLLVGQIPEWAVLLHACDNRRCVNPRHLSVGHQYHNVADMINKGRDNFNGRKRSKKTTWFNMDEEIKRIGARIEEGKLPFSYGRFSKLSLVRIKEAFLRKKKKT